MLRQVRPFTGGPDPSVPHGRREPDPAPSQRDPRPSIGLDDSRRGASRVACSRDALDCCVRRHAHLNALARVTLLENRQEVLHDLALIVTGRRLASPYGVIEPLEERLEVPGLKGAESSGHVCSIWPTRDQPIREANILKAVSTLYCGSLYRRKLS